MQSTASFQPYFKKILSRTFYSMKCLNIHPKKDKPNENKVHFPVKSNLFNTGGFILSYSHSFLHSFLERVSKPLFPSFLVGRHLQASREAADP